MQSIDWRTPAAYHHATKLPAAGFAWEYLRRNDEYRQDFMKIVRQHDPFGDALEAFVRRWGLRFPARSRRIV